MSETTEADACECGYEFAGDGPVKCPECGERLREPIHRYFNLDQIEDLRDAAHSIDRRYDHALRDEALIVVSADLGTRPNETVQLTRSMFDLDNEEVMLPAGIQKDYPIENKSPSAATLRLDPYDQFNTVRLLRQYFRTLEDDQEHLFPSRLNDQMSTQTVRDIVTELAVEGDVAPRRTDGQPADPEEAHPHAFRHSVANYMLAADSNLWEVRNRLRHQSVLTTERVYEHFQRR
ncbi:tyrosine-type recombinase/integrase [Natronorubrum sp. DTA28]|uniref:tyrosine-type recombinase/integrase n=1 Tax=Natronorubrum sp. DTA28 TaxID=3447019 RepID=UPI003F85AB1A